MFEQDVKGLSPRWTALNSSARTWWLFLLACYYCPQWTMDIGRKGNPTLWKGHSPHIWCRAEVDAKDTKWSLMSSNLLQPGEQSQLAPPPIARVHDTCYAQEGSNGKRTLVQNITLPKLNWFGSAALGLPSSRYTAQQPCFHVGSELHCTPWLQESCSRSTTQLTTQGQHRPWRCHQFRSNNGDNIHLNNHNNSTACSIWLYLLSSLQKRSKYCQALISGPGMTECPACPSQHVFEIFAATGGTISASGCTAPTRSL